MYQTPGFFSVALLYSWILGVNISFLRNFPAWSLLREPCILFSYSFDFLLLTIASSVSLSEAAAIDFVTLWAVMSPHLVPEMNQILIVFSLIKMVPGHCPPCHMVWEYRRFLYVLVLWCSSLSYFIKYIKVYCKL